jgi:hypothetical protein
MTALIQNFLGGQDEEWFVILHVNIIQPAQGAQQGKVDVGGTPLTAYLKKHIRERHDQRL